MSLVSWIVLGLVAAGLERWLLRRSPGSFLGSLMLAWAGAVLGGLGGYALGWEESSGDLTRRGLLAATVGIIVILGGIRAVQALQRRADRAADEAP